MVNSSDLIGSILSSGMKYSISEARKLLYFMVNPEDIRKSSEYHKFLFFEMYPLLYVSEFLPKVKWIRFSGTKKRYDGEIKIKKGLPPQKIEFVRAVDSDAEALLSQVERLRHIFPDFALETEAIDDNIDNKELFKKLKDLKWLWRKALRLKATKNLKTKQYNGVWLGIVFDDSSFSLLAHKKLRKRVKKICLKHKNLINRSFHRVFFIGLSGKFIFDSNENTL